MLPPEVLFENSRHFGGDYCLSISKEIPTSKAPREENL